MELGAANRKMIYDNADHFFWQAFAWTEAGRAMYTRLCRDHMEKTIADPAMRAKLTPDYPVGCKRILFTDEILSCSHPPQRDARDARHCVDRQGRHRPEGRRQGRGRCDHLRHRLRDDRWHWSPRRDGQRGIRLNDE